MVEVSNEEARILGEHIPIILNNFKDAYKKIQPQDLKNEWETWSDPKSPEPLKNLKIFERCKYKIYVDQFFKEIDERLRNAKTKSIIRKFIPLFKEHIYPIFEDPPEEMMKDEISDIHQRCLAMMNGLCILSLISSVKETSLLEIYNKTKIFVKKYSEICDTFCKKEELEKQKELKKQKELEKQKELGKQNKLEKHQKEISKETNHTSTKTTSGFQNSTSTKAASNSTSKSTSKTTYQNTTKSQSSNTPKLTINHSPSSSRTPAPSSSYPSSNKPSTLESSSKITGNPSSSKSTTIKSSHPSKNPSESSTRSTTAKTSLNKSETIKSNPSTTSSSNKTTLSKSTSESNTKSTKKNQGSSLFERSLKDSSGTPLSSSRQRDKSDASESKIKKAPPILSDSDDDKCFLNNPLYKEAAKIKDKLKKPATQNNLFTQIESLAKKIRLHINNSDIQTLNKIVDDIKDLLDKPQKVTNQNKLIKLIDELCTLIKK